VHEFHNRCGEFSAKSTCAPLHLSQLSLDCPWRWDENPKTTYLNCLCNVCIMINARYYGCNKERIQNLNIDKHYANREIILERNRKRYRAKKKSLEIQIELVL
jgi:hypothetical protein